LEDTIEVSLHFLILTDIFGVLTRVVGLFLWNAQTLTFFKSFDTKLQQLYASPVIFNEKLWCVSPKCIKIWPLNVLLDPNSPSNDLTEASHVIGLNLRIITFIEVVNEELWVTGDKTVIINKDHTPVDLNAHASATDMNVSSECFNIAQRILCVGDNIWILREKIIEIWDKIQRTLKVEIPRVKIIQMEGSKISSFTNIGNNVWMVGRHRNLGVAWVINPESYTLVKQLGNDPDQAKGSLHQAIQVGPLIWVVSWDKKILTWDAQTFQYCNNIPNCHRDAIECIVTRKSEIGEGWYVWTGSSDKTIDVMYVPENYAEKLKQLALEKHDTDPEICVSPVNITGIDPERRKKEKESPKANKLKKNRLLFSQEQQDQTYHLT